MEARAKQRLTGAIILVALFVLLVPELLTGPREAHPATETPSDEGLRRYTIDLDARNAPNAPTSPAADQPAVALPTVPAAPNSTLAAPGEAASPTAATPMAHVPSVPTTPNPMASAPAQDDVSPIASTPAPAPAQSRTESARPAPAGSFAVQLGTFGKRENAERLVRDMTVKGFTAFVVPTNTNGHELFRVRVGPARD